jgi:hypothetical protein
MTHSSSRAVTEIEALQKHCPKCKSARVHRSHRKTTFDRVLCAAGGELRRCHDCRSRQVWFGSLGFLLPNDGLPGGLASALLLACTFALCFLFIWWMISRFTELAG